jgi:hypothetical protein
MPKEEWDLPESQAEHRVNEASAVEVKFGGTAASFFEHLRLALSGEIPVHDTTLPFEMSCRRMIGEFAANRVNTFGGNSTPFRTRSVVREGEYFATG